MPGLQSLLEDYKNLRGRQEWNLGRQMDRLHPQMEQAMNLFGGFDTGGLAGMMKAYRGHVGPNEFQSTSFPGVRFLSTNKETARQYGTKLSEYNISPKLLNLDVNDKDARRILFSLSDFNELNQAGIRNPDDFVKYPNMFNEFAHSNAGTSIGMFPSSNAGRIIKSLGYDGVKIGPDDFWLAQ